MNAGEALPIDPIEIQNECLSVEDFKEPGVIPDVFNIGNKITRKNFCDAVIKSYAYSRGVYDRQKEYFEKHGLQTSFSNFAIAGGWKCFSNAEKARFKAAFEAINAHSKGEPSFFIRTLIESRGHDKVFEDEIARLASALW